MAYRGGVRVTWVQLAVVCGVMLGIGQPARAAASCVGDCDADGAVTVDELVRGVNIALGALPVTECLAFETNSDGEVTIDELLQGVNAALIGCPALPPTATVTATATPPATSTATGPTATATATPLAFGRALAGRAAVIANGLNSFAPLVTAVITGLENSDGAQFSCSGGGQVMRTCTGTGSVTISISFIGCTLETPDGSVTFDSGTITLRGQGACPNVVVAAPVLDETADLQATYRDRNGQATQLVSVSLDSSITFMTLSPGMKCFLTGGTVVLNGSISVTVPSGAGSRVDFSGTSMDFAISQFNIDCLPVNYVLTLNGSGTVTETASQQSFDATLTDFSAAQVGVSPPQFELNGDVSSACLGGSVNLQTVTPLSQAPGSACYNAGVINVTSGGSMQQLRYRTGDNVEIDTNGDGVSDEVYPSCLPLLACAS